MGVIAKARGPLLTPLLTPNESASLRDRLLGEVAGLQSAEIAASWARDGRTWSRPIPWRLASGISWLSEPSGPETLPTFCGSVRMFQEVTYPGEAQAGQNLPERSPAASVARRRRFEDWGSKLALGAMGERGPGSLG
jgi:hypothetical protein